MGSPTILVETIDYPPVETIDYLLVETIDYPPVETIDRKKSKKK